MATKSGSRSPKRKSAKVDLKKKEKNNNLESLKKKSTEAEKNYQDKKKKLNQLQEKIKSILKKHTENYKVIPALKSAGFTTTLTVKKLLPYRSELYQMFEDMNRDIVFQLTEKLNKEVNELRETWTSIDSQIENEEDQLMDETLEANDYDCDDDDLDESGPNHGEEP